VTIVPHTDLHVAFCSRPPAYLSLHVDLVRLAFHSDESLIEE